MSDVKMKANVLQNSYGSPGDNTAVDVRANRRGDLVTSDWMIQAALDGRVFNASNAILETAVLFGETARGTDNINPSILVDCPSGTTIIPLEVIISTSGTGTAGDFDVQICTDDKVRYSSGGAAVTPLNMHKNDPFTSVCSVYQGGTQVVASANTDDDSIFFKRYDSLEIATPGAGTPFVWTAKQHIPPILYGPASLLIYVIVGNVDASFFFSVKWAEIPSVSA